MAEAKAKTMQPSFHCLVEEWKDCELKPKPIEKWTFVDQKKEETKHRTEWCAAVNKYRCMNMQQVHEDATKKYRTKILVEKIGKWGKRHLGGHDLVRRLDGQGEVLIWCRKCSGYARQRVGPKWMNCCKPEQAGTKEHGMMSKRIQVLEDGRVPAKEARDWKIEGQKSRITRKEKH